jgi:DNA-binding transcriptional ArsR family regulator
MELNQTLLLMKALADKSRLMIVRALYTKPYYVEELSELLGLAVSTISGHLKKLENCGLIFSEKQQYYVVYHLKKELLQLNLQEVINFDYELDQQMDEKIAVYKQKIIDEFIQNKKLIKFPKQLKKRFVVFEELSRVFQINVGYSKNDVITIIKEIYPDWEMILQTFLYEEFLVEHDNLFFRGGVPEVIKSDSLRKNWMDGLAEFIPNSQILTLLSENKPISEY